MTVTEVSGLLTVSDVAKLAQVSQWTVRKEIADGRLGATRVRRCLRVRRDQYAAWTALTEADAS